MTLLAELFDRLESTPLVVAQASAVALVGVVEVGAPVLASVARQRPAATAQATRWGAPTPTPAPAAEVTSEPQRIVRTAATASPAWLAARDQYLSHAMTCRACHAPTGRHCPAGAELRATYDTTPMEPTR
ncbi:hypothetical protein D3C85_1228270 [compost metagenome]